MTKSLKEKIHDELLERIIKNQYAMNEFLKEGSIAKEFGVSKAPVREALIQLCNENIIRNIPRSGYQIVQLTERDIREATQFRIILEVEGLKLAARNIKEQHIKELREMTEYTEYIKHGTVIGLEEWWNNNVKFHIRLNSFSTVIGLEEWWNNNVKFHIRLNSFSNNSLLTDSLIRTVHLLWRAVTQLFWNADPHSYLSYNPSSHVPIYEAIKDGDLSRAEEYLRADILSILNSFSEYNKIQY